MSDDDNKNEEDIVDDFEYSIRIHLEMNYGITSSNIVNQVVNVLSNSNNLQTNIFNDPALLHYNNTGSFNSNVNMLNIMDPHYNNPFFELSQPYPHISYNRPLNILNNIINNFDNDFDNEEEKTPTVLDNDDINKLQILYFKDINNESSYTSCPICMESYTNTDEITMLKCKHYFHPECINKWLTKYNHICPICKTSSK